MRTARAVETALLQVRRMNGCSGSRSWCWAIPHERDAPMQPNDAITGCHGYRCSGAPPAMARLDWRRWQHRRPALASRLPTGGKNGSKHDFGGLAAVVLTVALRRFFGVLFIR